LLRAAARAASPAGTAGVREAVHLDSIERQSMACPALPLCGLAIGEAERAMPDINRRVRALLDHLGFPPAFPIVVRPAHMPRTLPSTCAHRCYLSVEMAI